MELTLVLIIIQATDVTEVLAELKVTVHAALCNILASKTLRALNLLHSPTVQFVILFIVMAEPTRVDLLTTWCHKLTFPFIMSAANLPITTINSFCHCV